MTYFYYKIPNQIITLGVYNPYSLATYVQCISHKPVIRPYQTTISLIQSSYILDTKGLKTRGNKEEDYLKGLLTLCNSWNTKKDETFLENLLEVEEYLNIEELDFSVSHKLSELSTVVSNQAKIILKNKNFYKTELNIAFTIDPIKYINNYTQLKDEVYDRIIAVGKSNTTKQFDCAYLLLTYLHIKKISDIRENLETSYEVNKALQLNGLQLSKALNMSYFSVKKYLEILSSMGLVQRVEDKTDTILLTPINNVPTMEPKEK